ncbi:OLC1v1011132C1 [Oldenlandia corymbosa var. corymbosa]|uniref:OLC1v1011132C1 n=1 Tax=Oldenlandia corymbosa var. corymbosa TaxID=529605 RepID=A0AAV1DVA8_OLDCO|nr:OLC1v1011132C1 [Oldenlandia corymbosa var. corymbosa]
MKEDSMQSKTETSKLKKGSIPPPPPPLPPFPKKSAKPVLEQPSNASVTVQEIAGYWRQKHKVEEDHLLAAIRAAARIRARILWENDYLQLEESSKDDDDHTENDKGAKVSNQKDQNAEEIRVGIKDWWTKSKYAYLNQPAVKSMDKPSRRASSYKPQFHCYKTTVPAATTTTFGIF